MSENTDLPVLSTTQGQIQGVRRRTVYEDYYYSFEGIPFAKPPLNELRFRAPQAAEAWSDIRDCSTAAEKSLQRNPKTGRIEGSEDCLYVNIYVKKLKTEEPLPVMVYIFGGAFYMGDSSRNTYGPDYFMQHDVILVTFNCRLDSLGFLSLADPKLQVPGNAGLKDQVLALKWIKQNITCFNGDANNITLFGESTGGVSTHYMTATEQARGLFHRAIPMSGCILNSRTFMPSTGFGFRLAKYHGYVGPDNDEQVFCFLHSLEASKLVTHDIMTEEDRRDGCVAPFMPTVEPYVGEDCVISKPPLEMLRTAWGNEIPMMLGNTSFEGLINYLIVKQDPDSITKLQTTPELVLPNEVLKMHSAEENALLADCLVRAHFGDSQPSESTLLQYLDLLSFKFFVHGCHRTVLSRLEHASAPTYLYRFDVDSPDLNFYRIKHTGNELKSGVSHADDLPYLFYLRESWKLSPETLEYKSIQRMVGMWTAFAKNSDPNSETIEPIHWHPIESDAPNVALNISNEVNVIELPETEKLAVWDSLYKRDKLY